MSEENGKVCCNCRHNIRTGEITNIQCHCDIDGSWLSYVTTMTHSCRRWSEDLIHQKFNNLTVIDTAYEKEYVSRGKLYRRVFWKCKCDCGNEIIVSSSDLKSGNTKSCGCMRILSNTKYHKTHGDSKSRLYRIWQGMISRCKYPSHTSYKWYGAKGVKVCNEWENSYEVFKEWAINNGYSEKLSIDRIDPYGNYEPLNCRWANNSEQRNNHRQDNIKTSKARRVLCKETGEIYSSAIEASKKLHIDFSSIYKACKLSGKAGGYTWEYEE